MGTRASGLCSRAPLSPPFQLHKPSARAETWLPGSDWCRSRTQAAARSGSAGLPSKVTDTSDRCVMVGPLAAIRYAERHGTRRPWLVQLMARRTIKVAAVALGNKMARMVWAIMTSGESYRNRSRGPHRDPAQSADKLGKGITRANAISGSTPAGKPTFAKASSNACC